VRTADRRRRKRRSRNWIVWTLLGVIVFAVGIALGEALNDNPGPGHTRTVQQTFTLAPESETVTVTTP
jgi:hypothetical protein